jgi:predicted transcriptional regulator
MEALQDPRHIRLVEWLVTPPSVREPQTQAGIAKELGVAPRTIRDWQQRDDVRRAWKKEADELVGDPSKVQEVLETLRQQALDPTHRQYAQCVKTYLEAVDAIKPPDNKLELKLSKDELRNFTDDELDARIAAAMADLEMAQRAHQVIGGRANTVWEAMP